VPIYCLVVILIILGLFPALVLDLLSSVTPFLPV
jgi:hypothetical protein